VIGSLEDRAKLRAVITREFVSAVHGKAFITEHQMFGLVLDHAHSAGTGSLDSIGMDLSYAILEVIQEAIDDGDLMVVKYRHPCDTGDLIKLFFPHGTKLEF
jgi:hypothetical protein